MKYKQIGLIVIAVSSLAIFTRLYDWYPQYESSDSMFESEYATEMETVRSGSFSDSLQIGDVLMQGAKWKSANCSVYCARVAQTKSELYINVVPNGYAVLGITVRLSDGREINVARECTNLGYTQRVLVPITDETVNDITFDVEWIECSETELTKFEDNSAVHFTSRNVVSFRRSGMYMIFDRYLNIVDVISVKRNEEFVVSVDSMYFSEVRRL